MSGTLYVVGTPIGNLGDISPRALETLANCDFIAAEDTRVTLKLLNRFEIKKPMVSYFEHNRFERGPVIAERILSGESCALVTDAGMPAISDPGEDLVKLCIELRLNPYPARVHSQPLLPFRVCLQKDSLLKVFFLLKNRREKNISHGSSAKHEQ